MKNEGAEDNASPGGTPAAASAGFLLYVESIPHEEWMKDPSKRSSTVQPAYADGVSIMDTPTKERHEIGYLEKNFKAWQTALLSLNDPHLPTLSEVLGAGRSFTLGELDYKKDGLKWRSDCFVRIIKQSDQLHERRLIIHLPNDGYFYVSEDLLPVMMKDQANGRPSRPAPRDGPSCKRRSGRS
jgi:hypothetical protein